MVAQRRRLPHLQYCADVLDFAPELVLRVAASVISLPPERQGVSSPAFCKGLISALLRAASRQDADATFDLLTSLIPLPVDSAGCRFGFSHITPQSQIIAIVDDLVSSAVRGEALLPKGPALSFYSEAGPGTDDEHDFHEFEPLSSRLASCYWDPRADLAEVRADNLSKTLAYFSNALRATVASGEALPVLIDDKTKLWAYLTEDLPSSAPKLSPDALRYIQSFFGALLATETEHSRSDIMKRIVNAFMSLAAGDSSNLTIFLSTFTDAAIKHSACRMALIQRFGVSSVKDLRRPMDVDLFMKEYLSVKVVAARPNRAVTALLTGVISSWLDVGTMDSFRVRATSHRAEAVADVLRKLTKAKYRILKKFSPNARDTAIFSTTILVLANRILSANKA